MKKGVIHFVQYVLVKILFFGAAYPLHSTGFQSILMGKFCW